MCPPVVPRAHAHTHTERGRETHRGIESWINASQASLASCCSSGETGRQAGKGVGGWVGCGGEVR